MLEHHALLYLGQTLSDTPLNVIKLATTTEIEYIRTPLLAIASVRLIIESAFTRPFEKATKTIVFEVGQIGIEAQHALLKVLEEPPATTRFILVMPSLSGLLPTLLSRLHQPPSDRTTVSGEERVLFENFIATSYADRLATILELTKAKDPTALRQLTISFQSWLEHEETLPGRARLLWCLTELPTRGSAKKMLWEEIALLVPIPK